MPSAMQPLKWYLLEKLACSQQGPLPAGALQASSRSCSFASSSHGQSGRIHSPCRCCSGLVGRSSNVCRYPLHAPQSPLMAAHPGSFLHLQLRTQSHPPALHLSALSRPRQQHPVPVARKPESEFHQLVIFSGKPQLALLRLAPVAPKPPPQPLPGLCLSSPRLRPRTAWSETKPQLGMESATQAVEYSTQLREKLGRQPPLGSLSKLAVGAAAPLPSPSG